MMLPRSQGFLHSFKIGAAVKRRTGFINPVRAFDAAAQRLVLR